MGTAWACHHHRRNIRKQQSGVSLIKFIRRFCRSSDGCVASRSVSIPKRGATGQYITGEHRGITNPTRTYETVSRAIACVFSAYFRVSHFPGVCLVVLLFKLTPKNAPRPDIRLSGFATLPTVSLRFYGGFVFVEDEATLTCEGATITGNHAGDQGGGVYARQATWLNSSCDLIANEAPQGAAIYLTKVCLLYTSPSPRD